MTPSSQLVVGCSEQLPNELRVYHLMGTSSDGGVLLSRHGATYSAAEGDVSDYGEMLEGMLGLVLGNFPVGFRPRARAVLTRRWNRDWGVEAEDLIQSEAVGDPTIERDGFIGGTLIDRVVVPLGRAHRGAPSIELNESMGHID